MDNTGEESVVKLKRKRNMSIWKDVQAKKLKAEGLPYVNRKGETKPARVTGNKCRCERGCLTKISQSVANRLLDNFNTLGSNDLQNVYLQGLIKVRSVSTKKVVARRRKHNFFYEVHVGDEVRNVCREAFASLHGIGAKRVRRLASLKAAALTPSDSRGKHHNKANKKSTDLIKKIDTHIQSFPYNISHYGSTGERTRYLSSNLNVLKMYELFLEKYYPAVLAEAKKSNSDLKNLKCEVKYKFYLNYFTNTYNYHFGRPRTDVCATCDELTAKIQKESNIALQREHERNLKVHKARAKQFYTSLTQAITQAKADDEMEVLCFDFKQNIPCPHIPTSDVFYKRQLWLYVMSVYSAKTSKSIMYTWPENIGKRGCNEVVSVLNHYIEAFVPDNVKKLYIFTDGCRGQNQNQIVIRYWQAMTLNGRFLEIKHHFPYRGHSFLPCDRHFGVIERMQKKEERVELPDDWVRIISSKFKVVQVNQNMLKDFASKFQEPYFKKTVTEKGVKFQITKYKIFHFKSDDRYMEVYPTLSGFSSEKFCILKPNVTSIPMPVEPLYNSTLPINADKIKNLLELTSFLRKNEAVTYYHSLLPAQGTCRHEENEED